MKKVRRREFAKNVTLAPLGLAAASSLLAKAEAAPRAQATPAPPKVTPPPPVAADHIFSVTEVEPFPAALPFLRHEMPPKLKPFPLGDVTLAAGSLQNTR